MRTRLRPILLTAAAFIAGCDSRTGSGPVAVSVIGTAPRPAEAVRGPLSVPEQVVDGAVAQGLVRFDAAGQVEPGMAERWIVIDDGMTYIFRLREANWPDGRRVSSPDVAAALKRQLSHRGRNPLSPFLSAIEEVVAMTPEVVEVRLARPRPDLLKLFAQPELALLRDRAAAGSGPYRASEANGALLLRPAPDLTDDGEDAPAQHVDAGVRLRGERAALAVTRFATGQSDLVAGGTFVDWPLVALGNVQRGAARIDPAAGLFGLAFVNRDGFLADAVTRDALAGAFDRAAVAAPFGRGWTPAETILPDQLDSAAPPALADWAQLAPDQRRAAAQARVAAWRAVHPEPLVLRVALPAGPGANWLWGHVAATLAAIGIVAERVPATAPAELRLIDQVAPFDSARWYLATACQLCGEEATARLEAARLAPTLAARADAIAAADLAVAADAPFVVLARPLRWSLVAPRLTGWQPNTRAVHPLNHLVAATK